jgi:hypothetical protein
MSAHWPVNHDNVGSRARVKLVVLNPTNRLGRRSRTMIIIGVDFHPEFQQIALMDRETGEFQEKRLAHR